MVLSRILEKNLEICKNSPNDDKESTLAQQIFNFEYDFYQSTEKEPFWGFDACKPHIATATVVLRTLCFAAKFALNFLVALVGNLPITTATSLTL